MFISAHKKVGGRCRDRVYRTDHADSFDVANTGFFIKSSLSPILRFRRRLKSACSVLKSLKNHGFAEDRWAARWDRWVATTKIRPIGPITSFEPWTNWILPMCTGSTTGKLMLSLSLLSLCFEKFKGEGPHGCRLGLKGFGKISPSIHIEGFVWTLSLLHQTWCANLQTLPKVQGFWFSSLSPMLIFGRHE